MKVGYDLAVWKELNIKLPINIPLIEYLHFLLIGATNSGKTYALLYLLLQATKEPNTVIWFLDVKGEFKSFSEYSRYFSANDIVKAIEDFYALYTSIRKGVVKNNKVNILVIEEYANLISCLTTIDKKVSEKVTRYISEILMTGRGLSFGIWVVTQRPDANLFIGGARLNFLAIYGLGRLTKEQKQMVFNCSLPDAIYKKGEGLFLADGRGIQEIKFPLLNDNIKNMVKTALMSIDNR